MDSAPFSRGEFAFLIGVPLAWAVLLLFHPTGEGDIYPQLRDDVTPWLVVHVGTMLFIPLLAVALYLLVRGLENPAARVCRIALVTFALFYTAWEVLMGIGTGVLVEEVNGLTAAERATGSNLVNDFTDNVLVRDFGVFNVIGSLSLITATIAAGIALRGQAGVPVSVPILLGLCGFMISAHPPPSARSAWSSSSLRSCSMREAKWPREHPPGWRSHTPRSRPAIRSARYRRDIGAGKLRKRGGSALGVDGSIAG